MIKLTRYITTIIVAVSMATLTPCQAALDILIIGSSQSYSESLDANIIHEKSFNPTAIATELQSILSNDSVVITAETTVNVVFEDLYRTKVETTGIGSPVTNWSVTYQCYSLAQYFMWPDGRDARLANLRGTGTAWDYIILVEDPYVLANFPGMYAEAVKLYHEEVSKGTAELILMSQWPEETSTFNAAAFNELAFRVGDSKNLQVVPAAKAWADLAAKDAPSTHPTPHGAYLAAASIYSKLMTRNASTSGYNYAANETLSDSLALLASNTVVASTVTDQYTGIYSEYNKFQMKYVRKRGLEYHQNGSSTEEGFETGLLRACEANNMTLDKRNPLGGGGPVDFNFSRGNDAFELAKQYRVDPALYPRTYGFPMGDNSNTGALTMRYGIDKRYKDGTNFDDGTDLGVVYDSMIDGHYGPTYDVCGIPVRLMWSKMDHYQPGMPSHRDGWHLSGELDRAVGAFMFTLSTGRCPIDDEPAVVDSIDWRRWYCRKVGYETAWQMSHMTARVPGFRVVPTAAATNVVTPGTSQTLSVQFRYPPTSNVTVNVTVDDPAAGAVSPATLTFTPANYQTPQTVTVSAAAGNTSGTFPFEVNLATASDDIVFNGHSDAWDFICDRKFALLSKTTATVDENGGTDTFTVALNWQPSSDVVLNVSSSATGEATVSPSQLTFTNGNWDAPQTVTITGVNDDFLATNSVTISVAVNDALSDDVFDGQPDQTVAVTCTNDDGAGFTLSKTTATVGENGGTDTFTVVLNAKPTSNVVLTLVSSNTFEATVSPATLTFTSGNWNLPQSVTLSGVDDYATSNDSATVALSIDVEASDDDFDGLLSQSVSITCVDNEDDGVQGSNTAPVIANISDQTVAMGGSAPWTPTGLTVRAWYDASDSGTINSIDGLVSEWADKSGNEKHLTQGNVASQPTTGIRDQNNLNVLDFDFSGDTMSNTALALNANGNSSTFMVGGVDSVAVKDGLWWLKANSGTGLEIEIRYDTAGNFTATQAGAGVANTALTGGPHSGPAIYNMIIDKAGGNDVESFYNGDSRVGPIAMSKNPGASSSLYLMDGRQGGSPDGFVGEFIIIDDIQPETRQKMEGYLAHKWGLVNSLGDAHPYKSEAPLAASLASASLGASVDDAEQNPLTLSWSVEASPLGSQVVIGDSSAIQTNVTFSTVGEYTLRLTATDNWGASDSQDFTVTVVLSDTAIVSVTASDSAASETGPDTGEWTISRTGNTDAALSVPFTLSGTANSGSDYNLSSASPLTIPIGQSSITVTLTPVDDSDVESGGETAMLTLTEDVAYVLVTASASISISDNDVAGTLSVTYFGNTEDGGIAPTDPNSLYVDSASVTVLGNTGSLTKTNNRFEGWNTQSGGGGTAYSAGDSFTITQNTTLYAQWGTVTTNHAVPYSWLSGNNADWSADYEAAALADHDGDGIPTWKEYWLGTDPLDKTSTFKIDSITIDGTDVVLEWQHAKVDALIPDILIQASPDLSLNSWTTVGTYSPTNGVNSQIINAPQTRQFYRLSVQILP